MDSQLSRSEKKRRAKGIEQLVTELAALSEVEVASLPCDRKVKDEIASAKMLKGGARKRQLKFAAKLLRDMPVEELYDFLAHKKGSQLKEKREFRKLESFRNLLLSEAIELYEKEMHHNGFADENEPRYFLHDSETIKLIADDLPGVDKEQLQNLAGLYARTRNRKWSRELFRIMKAAMEKAQFSQDTGKE